MRAFYAVVAGEFEIIHVTSKDNLDQIKKDIITEVYRDPNVKTKVVLTELEMVSRGKSTFMIEIVSKTEVVHDVNGCW